ncbi:hypothetical protein MPTK1_7g14340 [Marchantia polymorpha subsp. ruderalis]|uniref:Uncharacterized protein n=2 Tax=Marchantia polymorpha TaxID=3197 RepID=A0AAF6BZI2_MARPO|nr:hypothetical protein MARPO_0009s0119 [Marchantia polymorpha]BBN17416.1 hypothetical protein Mp_7g14340 [Marchantia polymorpha subsp. ruderalis]|eukprot:PTQ47020.1 hypothetical protein MARPO_0009s0119 [Marchantia polymorpha]
MFALKAKLDMEEDAESMESKAVKDDSSSDSDWESSETDNIPLSHFLTEGSSRINRRRAVLNTSPKAKSEEHDTEIISLQGKRKTKPRSQRRYNRNPPSDYLRRTRSMPMQISKTSEPDLPESESYRLTSSVPSPTKTSTVSESDEESDDDKVELKRKKEARLPRSTVQMLPKFRIALSKKEIREDWLKMTGSKLDGQLRRVSKVPKGMELCKSLTNPQTMTYILDD